MTHLQQTNFENILAKVKTAQPFTDMIYCFDASEEKNVIISKLENPDVVLIQSGKLNLFRASLLSHYICKSSQRQVCIRYRYVFAFKHLKKSESYHPISENKFYFKTKLKTLFEISLYVF